MLVRVPDDPVEGGSDLEVGLCNFKPKSSHDANEADPQIILSVSHSDGLNFPVLARRLVRFNKDKGGATVVTRLGVLTRAQAPYLQMTQSRALGLMCRAALTYGLLR